MTPIATETIQKLAGVCGGRARVRTTRISVWVLVDMKQHGHSDEEILEDYPSLTFDDLRAAWEYAADHADEIAEDIRQNYELE